MIKLKTFSYKSLLFALCVIGSACSSIEETDKEDIFNTTKLFSENYFNYYFDEASQYTTPESKVVLKWRASNVNEQEISAYNTSQNAATLDMNELSYEKVNDTTAIVHCVMLNSIQRNNLDSAPYVSKQTNYALQLTKRNKKWLIKMEGPLQSVK